MMLTTLIQNLISPIRLLFTVAAFSTRCNIRRAAVDDTAGLAIIARLDNPSE